MNNLKLDKRIIKDLITGKGVNDQKVLKALRGLDKAEDGASNMQWDAYSYIKENSLTRDDALAHIKGSRDDSNDSEPQPPFSKEESDSEIKIVIEKENLNAETVSQIEVLLQQIEQLSLSITESEAA